MFRTRSSRLSRTAGTIWVLLLVLALVLSACGGGPEPAAEEPAAAEEEAAQDSDEGAADAMMSAKEAPQLAEMVAAGDLPPLEERIPIDPLVINLPWIEVGKYGGTLKRTTTRSNLRDTSAYMYGHLTPALGRGRYRCWSRAGQSLGDKRRRFRVDLLLPRRHQVVRRASLYRR